MNYALSDQPDEKIAFYFKTLDLDNSGFLEEKEVRYAVELIFKVRTQSEARCSAENARKKLFPFTSQPTQSSNLRICPQIEYL